MQTKTDSFIEAMINTTIGFILSLIVWHFVAMAFGIPMPLMTNMAITAVSIARQYVLRRLFNGRTIWATIRGAAFNGN